MTHPDRENSLALLTDWHRHYQCVDALLNDIKASMGLNPEGRLFETVWKLFDAYSATLGVELGDYYGWLEWFQVENDMGAKGLEAGYDNSTKPILTLEDLYELLAAAQQRRPA